MYDKTSPEFMELRRYFTEVYQVLNFHIVWQATLLFISHTTYVGMDITDIIRSTAQSNIS